MKTLSLTIGGVVVARISGGNFAAKPNNSKIWLSFSVADLIIPGVTRSALRFDAVPSTTVDQPDMGQKEKDKGYSSATFSEPVNPDANGHWEIPRNATVTLRYYWPNPLSPYTKGLWMRWCFVRLRVVRDGHQHDELKLTKGADDHSAIWSWASDIFGRHDWNAHWSGDDWTIDQLLAELPKHSYVDRDGSECDLLTPTRSVHSPWLADLRGVTDLHEHFRLDFLRPGIEDGSRPLAATAAFKASTSPFLINSAALNVEERAAAALYADEISLVCARGKRSFIVEWSVGNVPADPPELLSLGTLYDALARHYTLGIASARSRNQVSFVPTRLQSDSMTLRFDYFDSSTRLSLRKIIVTKNAGITWTTGAAGSMSATPVRLAFRQGLESVSLREAIDLERESDELLVIEGTNAATPAGGWVINGVQLELQAGPTTLKKASLQLTQAPGADRYGQAPIEVRATLELGEVLLKPASDDPEIGFETLSVWLERERPMVIDLGTKAASRLKAEIRETASEQQSRLLRIGVRNAESTSINYAVDALVLDPSPLTAARVTSDTTVDPEGLVAEYTDDSDEAPEWTFASSEGEMTLVFPPQVIGEEMVKGWLHIPSGDHAGQAVPFLDEPFDIRLSPVTTLTLDRTDIDTARTVAPWSLRRLLGQRTGVVGAILRNAEFELLYGLTTRIEEVPGLRIAEVDALIGRVPFPDELLDLLRSARSDRDAGLSSQARREHREFLRQERPLETLRNEFAEQTAVWIRGMLYRPGRWPVFRDWTSRRQLTISGDGVKGALRRTRDTADPFQIDQPASPHARESRLPLRGGVDWPFQSVAVYDELKRAPESSSMAIEGLAFGTLGGLGKQTAEFNDGKTIIISDTTDGRLNSVTVIRVGRIAMLWNRARHVIVYERSTRRAPRYGVDENKPDPPTDTWEWQAPEFEGLAALRKVREYVEITEPKRSYPDSPASTPIAGPLKASFFETTVIPVKSNWGYDVPTGFVIALRGQIMPAEERFFPFPKIFLKHARARGKGEGTVDCQLRDPGEILFYTSTQATDGGDSDQWAPVPDLDFSLVPRIKPADLPFTSRFQRFARQPDASRSEFGQERFTITLDPAEEAVDLMHGRVSEGIEARVSSVSISRGSIATSLAVSRPLASFAQATADAHSHVRDGLAELRMQIAQARASGATTLDQLGSFGSEAKTLVRDIGDRARELAKVKAPSLFDWEKEKSRWNERYNKQSAQLEKLWKDQVHLDGANLTVEHAKSALESVCRQMHQRIDEAGFLPLEAMKRIDVAHVALEKRTAAIRDKLSQDFDSAIDRVHDRYDELLDTAQDVELVIAGLPALQVELDAAFSVLTGALSRFGADALQLLLGSLGDLFSSGGHGLHGNIATTLYALLDDLRILIAALLASVSPVELLEPDWDEIKIESRALLEDFVDSLLLDVAKPIQQLRADIDGLINLPTGRLKSVDKIHQQIETACRDARNALSNGHIETILSKFVDDGKDVLDRLTSEFDTEFTQLMATAWKDAAGSFEQLGDLIKADFADWLDKLEKLFEPSKSLEEIERDVEKLAAKIWNTVAGAARQVERGIIDEARALKDLVEGVLPDLSLTRILATGPINDAIRCTRDQLGYFYDAVADALDVTRASALFNELGASVLNALQIHLPFDRIRDRLLPQLDDIDLSKLLPDFGGLRLEYLFPELLAPDDGGDNPWIRVRHGFDKDRLTAFAVVDVDKKIDDTPAVFLLPPIALRIREPRFQATSRLEISTSGAKSQSTKASIDGDWMLCLSDKPIVTIHEAKLYYDSAGGFDFDFETEKVELSPELKFITDALKSLLPQEEGLTLTPVMPAGIRAELALPLPDLGTGAFTLTGITIYTILELLVADGFEVRTGFWLSKPERPFGLAILFLGGGGWVGVEASYRPPDHFVTHVSIGVAAGAFVAVNFSVARGSAGILFTAGVDFYRDWSTKSGRTSLTLGILIWGEFSILGIASASIRLRLSVTYEDTGGMHGDGHLEVSIKICWCYTLHVSRHVQQKFSGGSQRVQNAGGGGSHLKAVTAANSNVAL